MLTVLMACAMLPITSYAEEAEVTEKTKTSLKIVLDPGHGGEDSGAVRGTVCEKDLNLAIAEYLKAYLEEYSGVEVVMTRSSDRKIGLSDRTEIAVDEDADLLVSLHNNAKGPQCPYRSGSTVLVAKGNYISGNEKKEAMALEEQKLGCNILYELEEAGLENRGLLLRDSEDGTEYSDGTLSDYYAIVRNGVKNNLPGILIEHAFLDSDEDYEKYLSSENGLKKLARADARGIARYFQLEDSKGSVLSELTDFKVQQYYVHDGDQGDYELIDKIYYKSDEKAESAGKDSGKNSTDSEDMRSTKESSESAESDTEEENNGKTVAEKADHGTSYRKKLIFRLITMSVMLFFVAALLIWFVFKNREHDG